MTVVAWKFATRHVVPILYGDKSATLRYDPEESISPGDTLVMERADTGERFAQAPVDLVGNVSAQWFADRDQWPGHRSYRSTGELLAELRTYYPDADIHPETRLTLAKWGAVTPLSGGER
ncbi:hypothetical protein ACFQH6_19575 [Halobacteriaceae archaeon GCM10025711]